LISTKNQSPMKKKLLFCLLLINVCFLANAAAPPSATISYNTPFCQSSTLETVTLTGTGNYLGGTFTATPSGLFINAITGTISPSSSSPGIYVISYDVAANGIDPAFSVSVAVSINPLANAGADGSITVCDVDTTVNDLQNLITGEQSGGTWTRVSGTGGTFNPLAGTFVPAIGATTSSFIYTIVAPFPCESDTSIATVSITSQPNAGIDGSISVSNTTNTSIDLYSIISGFQPGGTWTRTSGVGGTFIAAAGTFNPFPDATTSTFSYNRAGVVPCVDDNSVATVTTSLDVVPVFDSIAPLCSGSVAPSLPSVSTNGITGSWSPAVIDTTISNTYVFTPDPGQSADMVTLTVLVILSPTATVVVPDSVVIGSPYVASFTGTPNASITYQINGGPNQIIVLNNAGQATIFFENAVSSTICLISAASASSGCIALLNNCVTVNIVDVPAPIGNPSQTFGPGATLADVVVTGTNIQWYDGADRNVNSNPLPMSTVLVNGATYYASQTSNGYESPDRLAVTVEVTLTANSYNFASLSYSPNPVENILNISSEDIFRDVVVYNYLGQVVLQQSAATSILNLDLGFLTKGNYFVKLESDNQSQVIAVIKE